MVKDDNPQADTSLTTALKELIRQMSATADDVDASTVGASVAAGAGNNGNGVVVYSTKRGDGLVNENILAEDIVLECSNDSTEGAESFNCRGETAASSTLGHDWPLGSGTNRSVTAVDAASTAANILVNGGFEDYTPDLANAPDDWEAPVATVGTTIKITSPEVQTIVVSGTPTTGTYVIKYTNPSSKIQETSRLAYNATGAQVQAALRLLAGLESVTVVTTGTTPNYTHTIYFYGTDNGNLTQLTSTEETDSGVYTHATTTNGSTHVFKGARAFEFDGDGSQLAVIQQKISGRAGVEALAQLAFNLFAKTDSIPAAGTITVSLWDGSAIINDAAGTANSFTIDCTALTTSYVSKTGVFRLPRVLPPIVYLRIAQTVAISNTSSVYLDHAALARMDSLYAGGPEVKVFSGSTRFRKGADQVTPDKFTLTLTNNRAGLIQEWFQRVFDLASKGLLLPSDTGNTESVSDALVS